MDNLIRQALLYDYYGELLTKQQRKIYGEVFFEDYSESEVAVDEGISRQGVHDMIARTKKLLEGYEAKLGLVEKHEKRHELIEMLEAQLKAAKLSATEKKTLKATIDKLKEI